ncbi:hypothetical protein GGR51DRAFT_452029 [Nemania sp. FL0031]|nr:hypothetical protein GGR51DRAFT_452029 [Nemania sp. FL0031]
MPAIWPGTRPAVTTNMLYITLVSNHHCPVLTATNMCPALIFEHQSDSESTDEEFDLQRRRRRIHSNPLQSRRRHVEFHFQLNDHDQTPLTNGGSDDEPDGQASQNESSRPHSINHGRPFFGSFAVSPMLGERDARAARQRNGAVSVRAFVRIQIDPLLRVLRNHIQQVAQGHAEPSRDIHIISSVISYLQLVTTLVDAMG